MALTYKYKIDKLQVNDENTVNNTVNKNAIVQAYWTLTGTDENENSGIFSGATPFTTVDNATFIPFENLQESDVIQWVDAIINENPRYKEHIDGIIQKQIDTITNPVKDASLPWD